MTSRPTTTTTLRVVLLQAIKVFFLVLLMAGGTIASAQSTLTYSLDARVSSVRPGESFRLSVTFPQALAFDVPIAITAKPSAAEIRPNPAVLSAGKRVAFVEIFLSENFSSRQVEIEAAAGGNTRSIILPVNVTPPSNPPRGRRAAEAARVDIDQTPRPGTVANIQDNAGRFKQHVWMVLPTGGNAKEVRLRRTNNNLDQRYRRVGGVDPRSQSPENQSQYDQVWAFPLELEGMNYTVHSSTASIRGRVVDASCIAFAATLVSSTPCVQTVSHPVLILEADPSTEPGSFDVAIRSGATTILQGQILVPAPVSARILTISSLREDGTIHPIRKNQDMWSPPMMREHEGVASSRQQYIIRYAVDQGQNVSVKAPDCAIVQSTDTSIPGELAIAVSFPHTDEVMDHQVRLVDDVRDLPVSLCRVAVYPRAMDQVTWVYPETAASVALANGLSASEGLPVAPTYLTFAGLGDSFGSGEGAPEEPFYRPWEEMTTAERSAEAGWLHVDCHRSTHSRLSVAAKEVARIPGLWVVYTNFACSGATMDGGFFGPPEGIKHPGQQGDDPSLQSQRVQLEQWMAAQGLQRLDAALVSFGGNESGFSTLIAKCAAPGFADLLEEPWTECDDLNNQVIARVWQEVEVGNPDSLGWIGISNLNARYRDMDAALGSRVRRVYLNEYPNPLFFNQDLPCARGLRTPSDISLHPKDENQNDNLLGLGGNLDFITAQESVFLSERFVDRLYTVMSDAAAGLSRWVFVDGQTEQAMDHGWCAREPWFNNFRDTRQKQHTVHGVLHPNQEGFKYMGLVLAHAIRINENLPLSTRSEVASGMCGPTLVDDELTTNDYTCRITLSPSDYGVEDAEVTAVYALSGEYTGSIVDYTGAVRTTPWHNSVKRPDFEVRLPIRNQNRLLRSVNWVIRNPDGSVAAEKTYSIN